VPAVHSPHPAPLRCLLRRSGLNLSRKQYSRAQRARPTPPSPPSTASWTQTIASMSSHENAAGTAGPLDLPSPRPYGPSRTHEKSVRVTIPCTWIQVPLVPSRWSALLPPPGCFASLGPLTHSLRCRRRCARPEPWYIIFGAPCIALSCDLPFSISEKRAGRRITEGKGATCVHGGPRYGHRLRSPAVNRPHLGVGLLVGHAVRPVCARSGGGGSCGVPTGEHSLSPLEPLAQAVVSGRLPHHRYRYDSAGGGGREDAGCLSV